jgi:hypothetical protein
MCTFKGLTLPKSLGLLFNGRDGVEVLGKWMMAGSVSGIVGYAATVWWSSLFLSHG